MFTTSSYKRRRKHRRRSLGVRCRAICARSGIARQESALEWRIHRANLPERWSLETFRWSHQPGVNRKQMRTFAELDFVAKHENLVLTGPTGVGKTGPRPAVFC